MSFLASPSRLRRFGGVGRNGRNVVLIARNNARKKYPLVDEKLKTKMILEAVNISAPKLLGVVKTQGNVRELGSFFRAQEAFVIKPARGSGGKGILVIDGRDGDDFLNPGGGRVHLKAVIHIGIAYA